MTSTSGRDGLHAKPPLVVILGATGVGKSRLAIDLALHFNAEVINADSMQVYKGLDIMTNKVQVDERRGVPHHLLGVVDPKEEFTAKQFRDLAVVIIDDILRRKKLPIVVGGTNYYIQALVSSYLLDDFVKENKAEGEAKISLRLSPLDDADKESHCIENSAHSNGAIAIPGTCAVYEHLKLIDPQAAYRIHPNNTRKLNQYIKIFERTGRKPSDLFEDNKLERWGTADTFRYNCCFLCLDAELSVLDRFVEQRVDAMMQAGLLDEILGFYAPGANYTRGLYQAIGISEFRSLFDALSCQMEHQLNPISIHDLCKDIAFDRGTVISQQECINGKGQDSHLYNEIIAGSVEELKLNTRKLVRLQKRRYRRLETHFGWDLHRLDSTVVLTKNGCKGQSDGLWSNNVLCPAKDIIEKFLKHPYEGKNVFSEGLVSDQRQSRKQFFCEVCSRIFIGLHQWQEHSGGHAHKKRVASLRKSQKLQALKEVEERQSG